MNPTSDVFEKRVAALEGGVGGAGFRLRSGAVTFSILNIAGAGDHMVSANSLYGGTYNLFVHTLPRLGVEVDLVDPGDPENFRRAMRPSTTRCSPRRWATPSWTRWTSGPWPTSRTRPAFR